MHLIINYLRICVNQRYLRNPRSNCYFITFFTQPELPLTIKTEPGALDSG